MATDIEERIGMEIWQLLQQLKRDSILSPEADYTTYEVVEDSENKRYPRPDDQRKIIHKLAHLGVLKIISKHYLSGSGNSILESSIGLTHAIEGTGKPKGFLVKIINEEFNKILDEYQKKYGNIENQSGGKDEADLYITKRGDDFYYKGQLLDLSKTSDYYQVFCSLYALGSKGGEIEYREISEEVRSRIAKTKNYRKDEMNKFIQRNLTDKSNGFAHYANTPKTEDNGKPLLSAIRGRGINFNNRVG